MCCFYTILIFLGPRIAGVIWWIAEPLRWEAAFNSWLWPVLGLIFLPWTTIFYVLIAPGGVVGWDWLWLGLGVFFDIGMHAAGGYRNRNRIPGQA